MSDHIHKYIDGYKGRLYKRRRIFNKNWKSRFFVLVKRQLRCFADENALRKLMGEYVLDEHTQIIDIPGELEDRKFLFNLTGSKHPNTSEELFHLSASSAEEKAIWIEALFDALNEGYKSICQPELSIQSIRPTF
jgi:hypothetical protein